MAFDEYGNDLSDPDVVNDLDDQGLLPDGEPDGNGGWIPRESAGAADVEGQDAPLGGYWAAAPAEELAQHIQRQREEHDRVMIERGFVTMYRIAHAAHFGHDPANPGSFDTQFIGVEGVHGDQLRSRVNEPASFLRQQVTMATGQKTAFMAVAESTDAPALAMAPINDAAVNYFMSKEMPPRRKRLKVRYALQYGASYTWWRWDKYAGEDVEVGVEQVPVPEDPEGATAPLPIYGPSGAPVATILRPWEHFCNPRQRERHLWRGAAERRNKFELLALYADYPEFCERIRGMTGEMTEIEQAIFGSRVGWSDDDLTVLHFYHIAIGDPHDEANPLRAGVYLACVGDVPIPGSHGRLPVTRKCGLPISETMPVPSDDVAFGHAYWWDLLAAQQGKDQLVSDAMSNATLFGRTNAFKGSETEMDLDSMAEGGNVFVLGPNEQAPGFMNPPAMPPTTPWLVEYYEKSQQSISGLNAVQRGAPGSNITSGEMAALFTNLAAESNSDTQDVVDESDTADANIVADLLALNAGDTVMIQIVGEDQRPMLKKYRTSQLKGIRNVTMQPIPAMMRNTQGRVMLFQLLQKIDPEERDEAALMITTGQARQATADESAEWIRIEWENEQLCKGIACTPSATDNVKRHLKQHARKWNELSLDRKGNEKALAMLEQHMLATLQVYYTTDPMLAAMLEHEPPPRPGAQPSPPSPKGGKSASGGDVELPNKPGEKPALSGGDEPSAQPRDRLGPKVPEPAKPPPGAAGAQV